MKGSNSKKTKDGASSGTRRHIKQALSNLNSTTPSPALVKRKQPPSTNMNTNTNANTVTANVSAAATKKEV